MTFQTSFHTIFDFLSYKCSSETCHSEGRSCREYHLQQHVHEGHRLIIFFMSNILKSLSIVKTLILFFTFNITVRKNRKIGGTIFSKGIFLVIILYFHSDKNSSLWFIFSLKNIFCRLSPNMLLIRWSLDTALDSPVYHFFPLILRKFYIHCLLFI